jgi:hypothetical protein
MIDYTIYLLNAAKARGKGVDVECASRNDVCAIARKMLTDPMSSVEIWNGRRLVMVLGAT